MSFGLVELITLLLSLSGFGLQANPRAPTADQALRYAVPDADIVVHVDATAIIGSNYKLLTALPNQPQIKASPELAKAVRKAVNEAEGLRGLAKTTTGIDITTDITDATLFVELPPPTRRGPPDLLVAVRGKFTLQTIDRLAKVAGPSLRIGGGAMIELPPAGMPWTAIGVTADGTFLAGANRLVKDRLHASWRPPARPANGNLAHVASVLDTKPVFAVALTLSPNARKQIAAEMKNQKNFITDVVARHKLAALALYTDGLGWTWIDSTRAGLDAMAQISEGMMDLLRATQIAPRGFAKIAMGALESYRGNKQVDALVRRKADLWKILDSYTGDGNFKVQIDKDPARLRLTARATAKSLSEVLPAGLLLPGMLWAVVMRGGAEKQSASAPAIAVPPPAPARPPRLSPKAPAPRPRP
jgi:hypothetical protein